MADLGDRREGCVAGCQNAPGHAGACMKANPSPEVIADAQCPQCTAWGHPALKWYEDCASDEDTAEGCSVPYDEHFYVGDDGIWTCEASRVQDVCSHCTNDDDERRVNFPCPTLTAIADALGVQREGTP